MPKFWSEMAERAVPYTPGEQPKGQVFIKLNTNESPYPPSPRLKEVLDDTADQRLYPDPTAEGLRSRLAALYGLDMDEVFVGNGSDEILAFTFMGLMSPKEPVSYPDITYSFYTVWAQLFHIPEQIIPLREGFRLALDDYEGGTGPVVIANPNAPTGIALPRERLKAFLEQHPDRLLIVDEAYVDFGGESMVPYIHEYPNLLVIQTFSKSRGLAGARLGFAMGQRQLIEALLRIKNSFNSYTISRRSLQLGCASLEDTTYFEETRGRIMRTRDSLIRELREKGALVTDSKANFLWLSCPGLSGQELQQALRERGILIRHFNQPLIKDYVRVTIGSEEDMETFKNTLFEIWN